MAAKRSYNGVILLVFVLGLPLISWYYLKKGIDFRRERLVSISTRIPLPIDSLFSEDGTVIKFRRDTIDELLHHFVFITQKDTTSKVIEDLKIQFTGIPRFRFIALSALKTNSVPLWADAIVVNPSLYDFLFTTSGGGSERVYLIDHNGDFRKSYPLNVRDSVVLFVQESATLLPAKSGQELKFERKKEM
jgi:hypothetical protein